MPCWSDWRRPHETRDLSWAACLLLVLGACTETRFESPPGDNIEACDARWKGLWVDASDSASKDEPDELAFLVDQECRFQMLERPEKDGPPKLIHVPLNFVHDHGKDYLVVADNQLAGRGQARPVHGVDPAPEKSFFIARYRIERRAPEDLQHRRHTRRPPDSRQGLRRHGRQRQERPARLRARAIARGSSTSCASTTCSRPSPVPSVQADPDQPRGLRAQAHRTDARAAGHERPACQRPHRRGRAARRTAE